MSIAKKAEYPTHVNRCQSEGICNVLLPEGKRVALFADHLAGRDTPYQMQKQVRDALFSRALAQYDKELGSIACIMNPRSRDCRLNVSVGEVPVADFGAREAAYLYAGQRPDREMGCLFEDRDGGEGVTGQQEFQDLSAAIRKLNVPERPSNTQNECVVRRVALSEYLSSRIGHNEMLPIAIGLWVWRMRSKSRCAEPSFTIVASHAR